MATPSELRRSYEHLHTTSDKIRQLDAQGVARADIARELGIKYQHVRNVLEQDKQRAKGQTSEQSSLPRDEVENKSVKVRIGPDGRIVVPAAFREAVGAKEGDVFFARLENGEIHLLTPKAASRRASAMLRKFIPEGVSLVDELIEERRQEAKRELENE